MCQLMNKKPAGETEARPLRFGCWWCWFPWCERAPKRRIISSTCLPVSSEPSSTPSIRRHHFSWSAWKGTHTSSLLPPTYTEINLHRLQGSSYGVFSPSTWNECNSSSTTTTNIRDIGGEIPQNTTMDGWMLRWWLRLRCFCSYTLGHGAWLSSFGICSAHENNMFTGRIFDKAE